MKSLLVVWMLKYTNWHHPKRFLDTFERLSRHIYHEEFRDMLMSFDNMSIWIVLLLFHQQHFPTFMRLHQQLVRCMHEVPLCAQHYHHIITAHSLRTPGPVRSLHQYLKSIHFYHRPIP